MTLRIAILGTGNVGASLGKTLSNAGGQVTFGVREESSDYSELLGACADDAAVDDLRSAAEQADMIFFAVPGSAAVDLAKSLASQLRGKVVVDCTNPLRWDAGPVWNPPPEGSNAAAIAAAAPHARVVKAFNTFGAEFHADPFHAGGQGVEVFIAGDDPDAKESVANVTTRAGFRVVDTGPLRNAAPLENLAILWIHLAMVSGRGRDFAFALEE